MPLGFYRVNSLARYVAPEAPAGRTAKTLTANGNVQVDTAVSKFGGGSILFSTTAFNDGTTDTIVTNDSDDFIFSGDLTWECWIYIVDNSTSDGMVLLSNRGGFDADNLYIQARLSDNKWQWGNSSMGANVSTATWSFNTWYHVALVRSGSGTDNFTLYIDGTSVGTDTFTGDIGAADSDFISIGGIDTGTDWFGVNGNIDEVRISTNARYTSSFTPSTTPFVNDENTVLLIHGDGTDGSTTFTDDNGDRYPVGLSAINNAQIDTAQSKFGGSSMLFDGTGDHIAVGGDTDTTASDDITIEGWVRFNSINSVWNMFCAQNNTNYVGIRNYSGTHALGAAYHGGSGTYYLNMELPSAASTGVWYHWAITKSGTTIKHFWDGTELTTTYASSGTMTSDKGFSDLERIGDWTGSSGYELDGHLDEFRMSDTARYSTGFTPSTSAFENDSNTVLLIHADDTDGSTDFVDDNGAA